MRPDPSASTRDRILFHLKTRGPKTTAWLAQKLGLTEMGVRQQLARLAQEGLVAHADERRPRGRPARVWRLLPAAAAAFPEGYGDLAVELLTSLRATFGAPGLEQLVAARTRAQIAAYRARMPDPGSPLAKRVAALVRIRSDEGYMAEWSRGAGGELVLVENHCPICAAAEACQGLCDGELELFRSVLGDDAAIERTEHMLDGARRCVYRVRPA